MLSLKLCDLRTNAELCGFQGITILKTGNMTSNNKALLGGSNKNSILTLKEQKLPNRSVVLQQEKQRQ